MTWWFENDDGESPDIRASVDARPAAAAPRRSREAVDLSQIPQLTDAEILILEDESKVGTREWKRADQVRSRIVDLIRWEKRRMVG